MTYRLYMHSSDVLLRPRPVAHADEARDGWWCRATTWLRSTARAGCLAWFGRSEGRNPLCLAPGLVPRRMAKSPSPHRPGLDSGPPPPPPPRGSDGGAAGAVNTNGARLADAHGLGSRAKLPELVKLLGASPPAGVMNGGAEMTKNEADKQSGSRRGQDHADMLKAALARPGIREVMQVYGGWQGKDRGLDAYRAAARIPGRITTANHIRTHRAAEFGTLASGFGAHPRLRSRELR